MDLVSSMPINQFDWTSYISMYEDLRNDGIVTHEKALNHWINHGQYENRVGYNFKTRYPFLFHKYLLNIADPIQPIRYHIIKKSESQNIFICHLHAYDIDKFQEVYGDFLNNLLDEFHVIVTYSLGTPSIGLLKNDMSVIHIKNKGVDIGAKMCALHFLENETMEYDSILFLHSKTDLNRRMDYFQPLIQTKSRIQIMKQSFLNNAKLLGIFPNVMSSNYKYNLKYYGEILSFLNIKNDDFHDFSEGNCFFCKKTVVDYIFHHRLAFFYNMLNENNSFDLNWFQQYYYTDSPVHASHERYISEKLHGNDNYIKIKDDTFPDGMIEHVYERIWLNVIKHLDGQFLLLDKP